MQMRFANRDDLGWEKGEHAYVVGDTMEMAVIKAAEAGFRPGSNAYAAFITAFSRQVRNRRSSNTTKTLPVIEDSAATTTA